MKTDYDYLILGAGCSAVSLALELADRASPGTRIGLLTPETTLNRDRLWCFWNTTPHRFETVVQHQWHRWKVRYAGHEAVHESTRFAYQYLPAEAFYEVALAQMAAAEIDLLQGTAIQGVTPSAEAVSVATSDGDITAGQVFDSRSDRKWLQSLGCLLQQYRGQRVRSETPVFEPGTLTLMDFDVSQANGITFVYLLPFSETEALVEPTVLSTAWCDRSIFPDLIREYLQQRYGLKDYSVVFEEEGAIPMTADLAVPAKLQPITPIGTRAGLVKGSSGYGFLPIQRWTQALAQQITTNPEARLSPPRGRLTSFLDRVFLAVLQAHPTEAPEIFLRLFQRVSADPLVRFLSECATAGDIAAVIRSMPKRLFLTQALKVLRSG